MKQQLQKSGEEGCFFYNRNGIYMKKLPEGVKQIRIFFPDGRMVEGYRLPKIFYIDSPKTIVEVEIETQSGEGKDLRYFKWSRKDSCFVED